jgi:dephospho-CoA kinase
VTGNIACGKSLVLDTLRELGAETIDADRVAHAVMRQGEPTWQRLVARFGEEIVGPDGEIDRRRLGTIVFNDPAALQALDAIVHPATLAAVRERIEQSTAPVAAVDAIKLYEEGLDRDCDEVWTVICDPAQQVERLMRRNGFSHAEALTRIEAQAPQAEKAARADHVIDNRGTPEQTRAQVRRLWEGMPPNRTLDSGPQSGFG